MLNKSYNCIAAVLSLRVDLSASSRSAVAQGGSSWGAKPWPPAVGAVDVVAHAVGAFTGPPSPRQCRAASDLGCF